MFVFESHIFNTKKMSSLFPVDPCIVCKMYLISPRFMTAQEKQQQGYRKQPEVTISRKRDMVEINMLRGHTAPIAPSENQVTIKRVEILGRSVLSNRDWGFAFTIK